MIGEAHAREHAGAVSCAPQMTGAVPCSASARSFASPPASGPQVGASSSASRAAASISSRRDGAAPHSAATSMAETSA